LQEPRGKERKGKKKKKGIVAPFRGDRGGGVGPFLAKKKEKEKKKGIPEMPCSLGVKGKGKGRVATFHWRNIERGGGKKGEKRL